MALMAKLGKKVPTKVYNQVDDARVDFEFELSRLCGAFPSYV